MLECVSFQQKLSESIIKNERLYPQMIDKIRHVYSGLKKMLKEK